MVWGRWRGRLKGGARLLDRVRRDLTSVDYMSIGVVGLGKMGSRIAAKLLSDGHELIVWNRSFDAVKNLKSQISNLKSTSQNLKVSKNIQDLVQSLRKPRVIWLMLPAGFATQNILDEVLKFLEKGDIVVDGGNSYFKDTENRYQNFKKKQISFLGIGVSGGIIAEKEGYPLMAGGDKSAYEYIKPILESLAKPAGGHDYFGEGGAGHFIKMIHNGIEYGIMQSLGEGFEVLKKSPYELDLLKVAKLWQKGTLVSGFMLDRVAEVLKKDPTLSRVSGFIESSGEADWTVSQAKEENVPVEIIEKSLNFRKRSQKNTKIQNSFTAKMISALRNAFGGHPIRQPSSRGGQGKEVKKK